MVGDDIPVLQGQFVHANRGLECRTSLAPQRAGGELDRFHGSPVDGNLQFDGLEPGGGGGKGFERDFLNAVGESFLTRCHPFQGGFRWSGRLLGGYTRFLGEIGQAMPHRPDGEEEKMNQDGRAQKESAEPPPFPSRDGLVCDMDCDMARGIRSLSFRDWTRITLKLCGGFQTVLGRPLEVEGSGYGGKRVAIFFPQENHRQKGHG